MEHGIVSKKLTKKLLIIQSMPTKSQQKQQFFYKKANFGDYLRKTPIILGILANSRNI